MFLHSQRSSWGAVVRWCLCKHGVDGAESEQASQCSAFIFIFSFDPGQRLLMFPHRWAAVHPQVQCLKRAPACCSPSSATSLGVNLTMLLVNKAQHEACSKWKKAKKMKRAEKKGAQNSPRDPHMCRLCAEGWDRHAKDSGALTASNILSWSVPCAECLSTSSVRFAVFLSPVSCWVKKKNRKYAISPFILTRL